MTITVEDMKSKLLTVDQWAAVLAPTDNLSHLTLSLDGSGAMKVIALPSGWNIGLADKEDLDLTDAKLGIGTTEYQFTKGAILAVCSAIGIPSGYVVKTPGPLVQTHLNYWLTHAPDTSLKFLVNKDSQILALAKQNITPFSNLALLDSALETIGEKYEVEDKDLYVDYKSHHDLTVTNTRLIIPAEARTLTTAQGEHEWNGGVQVRNSLTGKHPLSAQGYLFNWYCTNGQVTYHSEGKYNRKIMGQDFGEVVGWVSTAVKNVLDHMEHELEVMDSLRDEPVHGVASVLADVFKTYKVPLKVRTSIMDAMTSSEDFTYYGLVNAITQSANNPELPEHFVTAILEVGGDVAQSASTRCDSCQRVLA